MGAIMGDVEWRALIAARLAELEADDARGREARGVVELDQQAVGRLSRQDALLSQSMAKAATARREGERRALIAALHRLDAGDYGHCEDCGEEIPEARLTLDLTAMRCVSCASG
ncbi:TraR/DksA C4-type zinc finger protein [Aestuariicoccus sp. KMU-90]|uniref:TraR/DksA C4-type zinc finger protein n=2 Tax=Thetidibacter halocola TaxID=2827239 RepID=A0A8J7WB10_9RHOB|nr:TraR/DksA C4-type zinc finger protein [Thetidibacter halocola]